MRATNIREGNLLYSKFIDLNVNPTPKTPSETSRIVFDMYLGPAR